MTRLCKPPKRITVRMLRARDACPTEIKIFRKEWPKGAEVTADNLRRAAELGMFIDWLGDNFIKGANLDLWCEFISPHYVSFSKKFGQDKPLTESQQFRARQVYARVSTKRLIEIWGLE